MTVRKKVLGKAKVPAPRLLSQQEFAALHRSLLTGRCTQNQAWSMYHLLVLTINVQADLIARLVASGWEEKDARVLLRADYEKQIKKYQGALLAVHEPEPQARPS